MQSFSDLKNSRQKSIDKINQKLLEQSEASKGFADDVRFWKADLDKSGNGYAVLRFLPAPPDEDLPWAKSWNHGFQGVGGWYIEECPTTVGKKCPVCEYNSSLWNSGIEANKDIARKQKRRLVYVSNIYVIKDPANSENEGKIHLYKFGKKIFDKVNDLMNPEFEDESPVNPFDLWEGANFRLKIRKVDGYNNFDKSEFDSPSAMLDGDDEKLEELWNKEYLLAEFTDDSKFKEFDELKSRLDRVLNSNSESGIRVETSKPAFPTPMSSEVPFDGGQPMNTKKEVPVAVTAENEDDDESLSYFQKLANEE
jgi:hypothetical protein